MSPEEHYRFALAKVVEELKALDRSDSHDPEWPDYVWRVTGAVRNYAQSVLDTVSVPHTGAPTDHA